MSQGGISLPATVNGWAQPGFESVVKAFAFLFARYRLGGGAMCVYVDGEPALDLWAGSSRTGEAWTRDTAPPVFSASKGVTSAVIHRLVDRGLLAYEAPVSRYWPEFAANGKERITLDDVMSHRAGLSRLEGIVRDVDEMFDPELMADRLAAAPVDRYFEKPSYHALTIGWILGRLATLVTGKQLGELYRSELAEPLGVDGIWLGRPPLGAASEPAALTPHLDRIVRTSFIRAAAPPFMKVAGKLPGVEIASTLYRPGAEVILADDGTANAPVTDMDCGSASGCCTAPALAKMYAALAGDGSVDGRRLLSPELTRDLARRRTLQFDRSVKLPMSWHRGYHSLPGPGMGGGFGHIGLGGSAGWADQKRNVSVAVVHNRLPMTMLFDQCVLVALLPFVMRAVR